jgi:hypothetical protein
MGLWNGSINWSYDEDGLSLIWKTVGSFSCALSALPGAFGSKTVEVYTILRPEAKEDMESHFTLMERFPNFTSYGPFRTITHGVATSVYHHECKCFRNEFLIKTDGTTCTVKYQVKENVKILYDKFISYALMDRPELDGDDGECLESFVLSEKAHMLRGWANTRKGIRDSIMKRTGYYAGGTFYHAVLDGHTLMSVTVPDNTYEGAYMIAQSPSGQQYRVVVPRYAYPGTQFQIIVPV